MLAGGSGGKVWLISISIKLKVAVYFDYHYVVVVTTSFFKRPQALIESCLVAEVWCYHPVTWRAHPWIQAWGHKLSSCLWTQSIWDQAFPFSLVFTLQSIPVRLLSIDMLSWVPIRTREFQPHVSLMQRNAYYLLFFICPSVRVQLKSKPLQKD